MQSRPQLYPESLRRGRSRAAAARRAACTGDRPKAPTDTHTYVNNFTSIHIPTQLIADHWEAALADHPDRAAVALAVSGIHEGAKLMYDGPHVR